MSEALQDLCLVSIDVETTGRDVDRGHRVCEIALLPCGASREVGLATVVHPGRRVTMASQAIHGLDDVTLLAAPSFEDIAGVVLRLLRDHVVVGHGLMFDLAFLSAECRLCQHVLPPVHYIDTLSLATRLFPDLLDHKLSTLAREFDLPGCRLPTHSAYADARLAQELLYWMIDADLIVTARDAGLRRIDWRVYW